MEFRALGPVGVVVHGEFVALGSPKLRTALTALLIDANTVVSSDRLIDILWGDDPPVTARSTLQKLIYRLRMVLEPDHGGDHFIATRAPGYVLQVAPADYDVARFEQLVLTARTQADEGAVRVAITTLDDALGLWHGPAFAEFAFDDFARAEAARLEELRLVAIEDRADAKLALGRHEQLIGELERTIDVYPLRERSRAQLMLALYRAGRQVEALRAYADHRRFLAEELGIEPSAALRALESAMVVQDPALDYKPAPVPQALAGSSTSAEVVESASVRDALAEAEAARAWDQRVARATASRIDVDLLEDELVDDVLASRLKLEATAAGSGRAATMSGRCPYKGLASFETSDAAYFFGRDRLVAELVARLAVERYVAVVGVSGSGKSSLLLGGLVPAVAAGALPGSEQWLTVTLTPGERPLDRLVRSLAAVAPGVPYEVSRRRLHDHPAALEAMAAAALATAHAARLLVVIDQFEELFTACRDGDERARFAELLRHATADPRASVSVVVALRADYHARCATVPALTDLVTQTVFVGAMTDRELSQAIEGPARRAGLHLERGLTDAIVADVGVEPGGLPLLSTALLETWVRRDDDTLTLAGYTDAGGVSGAVAHLAEDVYERFTRDEQETCRRIVLRLAEPGDDGDEICRRVGNDELLTTEDPHAPSVLAALIDRRLLTTSADGVEIAHEALLREWPRAQAWLDDDRVGRRLHHRLAGDAAEWDAAGRDAADLYRGARLASALDWSAAHPGIANASERAFLSASDAAHDAELRNARRSARRLRGLLATAAVLLAVAVGAGTIAAVQRGEARDATRAADAARLATEARTKTGTQLGLALLLGIEARRLEPSSTTDGGLEAALAHVPPGLERLVPLRSDGGSPAVSPDGRHVVAVAADGNARIVDVESGRVQRKFYVGRVADLGTAGFSGDGRFVVASTGSTGTVRVFDAHTGRPATPPLPAGAGFVYGAFVPTDSSRLLTVSPSEVIRWDLSDAAHPRELGAPLTLPTNPSPQPLTVLRIAPNGQIIATAAASLGDLTPRGPTLLWNFASGTAIGAPLAGLPGPFTPDSQELTLARPDEIVFVGASTGVEQGAPIEGFTAFIDYTISSDGRRLAAADLADGTVRVFDVTTRRQIGQALRLLPSPAAPLAFLAGDRLLVAGSDQVAVWRYLDTAPPLAILLRAHTGTVDARFTPDGNKVVTTGIDDHQLLTFRARDGRLLGPLVGRGPSPDSAVALSPDGTEVAVPDVSGDVGIWDVRTKARLSVIRTGEAAPTRTAWSPTGPVVATAASEDRSLRLWDVSNPRHPKLRARLRTAAGPAPNSGGHYPVFSPDGSAVVVNDYDLGRLTFVDVRSGRVLRRVSAGGRVLVPVYSPDGRTLAAVTWGTANDYTLELIDPNTGKTRNAHRVGDLPVGLSFVNGGRRLATLSLPLDDLEVRRNTPAILELWDATTLSPVGAPTTFTDHGPWFANPSADGDELASGTTDGSGDAVVWDLDPRHWETTACRIAGRNLTRAEWNEYLPGRSYDLTCPQ